MKKNQQQSMSKRQKDLFSMHNINLKADKLLGRKMNIKMNILGVFFSLCYGHACFMTNIGISAGFNKLMYFR